MVLAVMINNYYSITQLLYWKTASVLWSFFDTNFYDFYLQLYNFWCCYQGTHQAHSKKAQRQENGKNCQTTSSEYHRNYDIIWTHLDLWSIYNIGCIICLPAPICPF